MLEINGTAAIVTGGASGLGEATVRLLAERGARVVVLDVQDEPGRLLAKEVDGIYARADVRDAGEVTAAVEAATELGPLRTLVNCAGVGQPTRIIGRDGSYESAHSMEAWDRVVSINLTGTFNCTRLAASAMSRTEPQENGERGAIVNTASIAAFDAQIGQASYAASKAGVVGMTLALARDLASVGIRVNTIAPGLIDTPIYGTGELAELAKAELGKDVLFPARLGLPVEFATMALELITNSYMNGETIRVDGGARLQAKTLRKGDFAKLLDKS